LEEGFFALGEFAWSTVQRIANPEIRPDMMGGDVKY